MDNADEYWDCLHAIRSNLQGVDYKLFRAAQHGKVSRDQRETMMALLRDTIARIERLP
jgi:hypothetical protein